jgi:hypothetical protein
MAVHRWWFASIADRAFSGDLDHCSRCRTHPLVSCLTRSPKASGAHRAKATVDAGSRGARMMLASSRARSGRGSPAVRSTNVAGSTSNRVMSRRACASSTLCGPSQVSVPPQAGEWGEPFLHSICAEKHDRVVEEPRCVPRQHGFAEAQQITEVQGLDGLVCALFR